MSGGAVFRRGINTGPGGNEEEGAEGGVQLSLLCFLSFLLSCRGTDRNHFSHNAARWLGAQVLKPESGFVSHFHHTVALWHQAGLLNLSAPR